MGIMYNKEIKSKDRLISNMSPRDRQIKQTVQINDNSSLISELRDQISRLQNQLSNSNVSGYTPEQVNEEIIEAVKSETVSLRSKIDSLEKELSSCREIIRSKDEIIAQLKSQDTINSNKLTEYIMEANKKIEDLSIQIAYSKNEEIINSNRPKMEKVFIDPTSEKTVIEKCFTIDNVSTNDKVQMENKVNKLKGLFGNKNKTD